MAWAELTPVGADNTDAGRAVYAPNDRHAVISGNLDGFVSLCVARGTDPTGPVECQEVNVKQEFKVEPDEGPYGVDVTPVIFADGGRGTPAP